IAADDGYFNVAFFGTMGRQFAFEPVFGAARLLQQAKKPIRFVLCGDGDRLEHYRAQAARLDNVVFSGWVGMAEIETLMHRSAVGLAPYRESPSFAANIAYKSAEYLSGGLPIALSFDRGALFDLLRDHHCGFSYGGDAVTLAEQL